MSTSNTRIYVVINKETKRLVEAGSAAQAIRHCVRNQYSAKAATPREVAAFMGAGFTLERAGGELIENETKQQEQTTNHNPFAQEARP